MSGGQLIVANAGSFNGAHAGLIRAARAPQAPPPPALQLPEASVADIGSDPEVHPGTPPTSARAVQRGGTDGEEDEDFNDENEVDVENATPAQASVPAGPVLPLGPSVSQPVCTPQSRCSTA